MKIYYYQWDLYYLIAFFSNFVIATSLFSISLETVATTIIPVLLICFYLIIHQSIRIRISNFDKKLLFFFYSPILLSILATCPNTLLLYERGYSITFLSEGIVRIINYFINLVIILLGLQMTLKEKIKNITWFYWSLLVFLFFGVWQYLHFYFGVPIVQFETRDALHSIANNFGIHRITSIAREPSFFAPLIIETIILSFFLKNINLLDKRLFYIIISISAVIAIFTLSPSVYGEVCILGLILLIRSKKVSYIIIGSVIASFIILLNIDFLNTYILPRFEDASSSSRFLQFKVVIETFFKLNIFTILFGCGPKSLSFIGNLTYIDSLQQKVHHSTNNIIVDLLVDNGIIGVCCIMLVGFMLAKKSFSIKNSNIPALYCTHFLVYNLYRGEYVSPRFAVQIIIILSLIYYYNKLKELTLSNNSL